VRLAVPAPPEYLRPDMTVSVEITVGGAGRMPPFCPPTRCAGSPRASRGSSWSRDAHAQRREVEIGISGDTRVEVLRGVAPGDPIIPAAFRVAPGDRVRVTTEAL
jgi:HlyD family secretion protein